jgi:hypothetical protein
LVKFLGSLNDSELCWRYAHIIFPAASASQGGLNKNTTVARSN